MQRAVACALLAEGESFLRRPSRSADCLAALAVARALGAAVEDRGDAFAVRGLGADVTAGAGSAAPATARKLSCGESGLCIRMFSPVAALFAGFTELGAEGSLRSRPVGMIAGPLAELGAGCETTAGLPPVLVRGPLRGGRARVDGRESSQLLTGLLVALPVAGSDSLLEVEGLASRGYVDLTLDTMRAFGVRAERDAGYRLFRVPGGQRYRAADFTVEGDWSGAAFLLVAAALAARTAPLIVDGLDAASSQPDRAILDALRAAGAAVEITGRGDRSSELGDRSSELGDPALDTASIILVRHAKLVGFDFDATDCPDLFPPLVALAAACEGETRLRGALRLKGKESDRATALREEFAALGAAVTVDSDLMTVRGCGMDGGGRLTGGKVDSRGDHRIAMAAAVASLACSAPVLIEGSGCVAKSWPGFFEDLASIANVR
jgi:3-phosphoshikimate 1-carboxyvinyltransferase